MRVRALRLRINTSTAPRRLICTVLFSRKSRRPPPRPRNNTNREVRGNGRCVWESWKTIGRRRLVSKNVHSAASTDYKYVIIRIIILCVCVGVTRVVVLAIIITAYKYKCIPTFSGEGCVSYRCHI